MDTLDLFAELSAVFLSMDGRLIPAFIAALSHVTEQHTRVGQRELTHAFRQALLVSPGFLQYMLSPAAVLLGKRLSDSDPWTESYSE